MTAFKIATWNVNSLRVRLPQVLAWLKDVQPDVLALQETKLIDDDFPTEAINDAGYSVRFSGQKTYNGVAILSKLEAEEPLTAFPGFVDPQRRILGATVGDVRVLNLYIPNGEHITSQKYQYKLQWLDYLHRFVALEAKKYPKMIILGDFNIAPEETDVYDPKSFEGQVLFSEPERDAFRNMLKTGFDDCFRLLSPEEQTFSWWDYRLNAFKRNLGLRIDHILASRPFSSQCVKCYVDTAPRKWERPSDHAPVIAEFQLA